MLRVLLLMGLLLGPLPFIAEAGISCDLAVLQTTGSCPATTSNDGSTLTISGTRQEPGSDPGAHTDVDTESSEAPETPSGPSDRAKALAKCMDASGTLRCADLLRPATPPPTPQPGTPPITMSDLVQFAPAPAITTAEPGNVGIAGLPTNLVADAAAQTVSGFLFGAPITVRFTPVAYEFSFGDGATATLDSPGQTWASLGQAQFSPTPTSHVYRLRGSYLAAVDVRYEAEADLGTGWLPVEGELRTDGAARQIRIFEARTALVAHTCAEMPTAQGC